MSAPQSAIRNPQSAIQNPQYSFILRWTVRVPVWAEADAGAKVAGVVVDAARRMEKFFDHESADELPGNSAWVPLVPRAEAFPAIAALTPPGARPFLLSGSWFRDSTVTFQIVCVDGARYGRKAAGGRAVECFEEAAAFAGEVPFIFDIERPWEVVLAVPEKEGGETLLYLLTGRPLDVAAGDLLRTLAGTEAEDTDAVEEAVRAATDAGADGIRALLRRAGCRADEADNRTVLGFSETLDGWGRIGGKWRRNCGRTVAHALFRDLCGRFQPRAGPSRHGPSGSSRRPHQPPGPTRASP